VTKDLEMQTFCPYYELLDYTMFTYGDDRNPRLLADKITNGDCRKAAKMNAGALATDKKKLCFPKVHMSDETEDIDRWTEGDLSSMNFAFEAEVSKNTYAETSTNGLTTITLH
jgi:hypothetical protein